PAQRPSLFDRALHEVAQRTRPVDHELGSQPAPDLDRVRQALRRILAHLRGLGSRTGGPYRVMERLRSNHGAANTMLVERALDIIDDFPLALSKQIAGGNHVRIVRTPVADADAGILANHIAVSDRVPGWRVEQRLALIGRGPLRPADKMPAPDLRRIAASAGGHEAFDQRALRFAHVISCNARAG